MPAVTTTSESFKSKINITENIPADDNTTNVKIAVSLKYLSNFCRTLEISLINCEFNLILTWSADCVISSATGAIKFGITDIEPYAMVVTLLSQDNAKLLEKLNQVWKEQLTGTNIYQKINRKKKPLLKRFNWC